jgi:hypothetical protein
MSSTVIVLGDSDDEEALPAPTRGASGSGAGASGSGANADDALVLSDDDDAPASSPAAAPAPAAAASAAPSAPAAAAGTGDADAPLVLEDDDAPAQQRKRHKPAACALCDAARLSSPYKLAACGHSFCGACLRGFVGRKLRRVLASEVSCPTCDTQLTIADVQALNPPAAASSSRAPPPPPGVPAAVAAMLQRHGMHPSQLGLGAWGDGFGGGPPAASRGGAPPAADPSTFGARPVGSSVATRRLMKELQAIRKTEGSEEHGYGVSLPDEDNLYTCTRHAEKGARALRAGRARELRSCSPVGSARTAGGAVYGMA